MKLPLLRFISLFAVLPSAGNLSASEPIELTARVGVSAEKRIFEAEAKAECFSVEFTVDPVLAEEPDVQVVAGVMVGLPDETADRTQASLVVDLREKGDRDNYALWHRTRNLTSKPPDPKTPGWVDNREYQHPDEMAKRDSSGHRIRLVVSPEANGSRVRMFVNTLDRPQEEHLLNERITAGVVKLFSLRGGLKDVPTKTSRFTDYAFETLTPEAAQALPAHWETVLHAIDYSYPPMAPIAKAMQQGRMDLARTLFLRHMRSRRAPQGPTFESVAESIIHPDWQKIADAALEGEYGTAGYFSRFQSHWTDTNGDTHEWVLQKDPLQLNWAKDNGFLNRHFHWVSLAKAYDETDDGRYAKQFSDEVFDWVSREPFFWDRCPAIGGLNIMDGTIFRWGYMNTSNIGRRLELTWWPAYEVFRKAPEFSEEAHFAMLAGMIRQAELITNPSSFAVHDDGAAHTTMALLQTAMMLPEFKASTTWKALALERWDEMLARQFHPDGSHVSLSLGYNWATISTLQNFLRLMEQLGGSVPPGYLAILEKAFEHPMLLSTPGQSMIPLNDAGWGLVDDKFSEAIRWFPNREDFKWMATKGIEGTPPAESSLYFPHAGQYVMRTGWGAGQQYLFFGAGPWGASHGKHDALNIFTQFGHHALIRDAGRGSYSGIGNTVHAGRSLSYNTLSPDWAQENSIAQWKQEMHRGFNPPKRRWVSNDQFDYGEGSYEYGWHRPGEHIGGKWLRQVIFVKGARPARDGYYVVIDTVEPEEEKERTWRHPWQLNHNPSEIAIREADHSVTAISSPVALQILPVNPAGDLNLSLIEGQEKPELLGWRVYDTTAHPFPVPTYDWKASGTFSRAWVIQMQATEAEWPVRSISEVNSGAPGQLEFYIQRRDGGRDRIIRRFPGADAPDVMVVSQDPAGKIIAELKVADGLDSVAKRR